MCELCGETETGCSVGGVGGERRGQGGWGRGRRESGQKGRLVIFLEMNDQLYLLGILSFLIHNSGGKRDAIEYMISAAKNTVINMTNIGAILGDKSILPPIFAASKFEADSLALVYTLAK